ncbi:unnamed protein product, partial [marine sediment metagenome]
MFGYAGSVQINILQQTQQTYVGIGTSTQFALAHKMASLLEASIHEPITINELAGKLNVNRSYLSEVDRI